MIVAVYMSKYDKNALYALKGYLDKEFPEKASVTTVVDDDHIHIEDSDIKVDIPMGMSIDEVMRKLITIGWFKSFTDTVHGVVNFLRDPYPVGTPQPDPNDDESKWLLVTSSRIARESHENPMYHQMVFNEARRNASFKWKHHDGVKSEKNYEFFLTSTRVFGFDMRIGHDSFLGGHVQVRQNDAKKLADFLEACFLHQAT